MADQKATSVTMAQFVVPGMHCAGCLNKTERALKKLEGVSDARANLSTKRLTVDYDATSVRPTDMIDALEAVGFDAAPFDVRLLSEGDQTRERELLKAMGVSGFAAANIMLLSVGVWAGLVSDMTETTRTLFHWISAAIALPAVVYAGRPFYRSAIGALQRGQMNMDVPIALAVILAAAASLMQTMRGDAHVYFDASVSLLFFLLIGRFLDQRMRGRASEAAQNLLNLRATEALVLTQDGRREPMDARELEPGMIVLAPQGMRLPADGVVIDGESHIDASLISGETTPQSVRLGDKVFAGTLNQGAALKVEVSARDDESLLAEIVGLMEAAEQKKSAYVQLADRLVRYYAPGVHLLAAATFAGWMVAGFDWYTGLMAAVAVLIVTCPCALGLAVPVVQVVVSGRFLKSGMIMKNGDALERLAEIDHVVFDKTGTLTGDKLEVLPHELNSDDEIVAAALAGASHHPLARTFATSIEQRYGVLGLAGVTLIEEISGQGIRGQLDGRIVKLGNARFVGADMRQDTAHQNEDGPEIWYRRGDGPPLRIGFRDPPRSDAAQTIASLKALGLGIELLSGDRSGPVGAVADALGIETWRAGVSPAEKIEHIEALTASGKTVLMVGDGLNDGPALTAAHASLSPTSASDVAQN
ncbi:MAG: heavy metal translocating P-type ATPase, partial [Pseudomonadota bacterium]